MVKAGVRFLLPSPELRPYLTAYYTVEVEAPPGFPVEDRLHPEWGNLRIRLAGEWEVAPLAGGFRPTGEAALFGPTSCSAQCRSLGALKPAPIPHRPPAHA